MKILRSLYLCQPRKCIRNGARQQPLPDIIAAGLNLHVRTLHGSRENDTKETKELKSSADKLLHHQQDLKTMLRLHPEPVLEPGLYMSVTNSSHGKAMFDKRPPGTHHESGAIKRKPPGTKRGRWKAFLLVMALIYAGGQLSSLGARMLHEFEIFALPDEDDDD